MVGTPLDLIPYVRGVQLILSGYSGYAKGKRIEVDKLVREEMIRAGGRVRSHMQNIHDTAFREDKIQEARAAKQCMEECLRYCKCLRQTLFCAKSILNSSTAGERHQRRRVPWKPEQLGPFGTNK